MIKNEKTGIEVELVTGLIGEKEIKIRMLEIRVAELMAEIESLKKEKAEPMAGCPGGGNGDTK
jgi:hypothetical protein